MERTTRSAPPLALVLLLVACASAPESTTVAGSGHRFEVAPAVGPAIPDPALESHTFALVNRMRRENGLPELMMRMDLVEVARGHALDMANRGYFSHYSPEGEGPGDRAERAGVSYRVLGENLARVRNSDRPATLAVDGWLKSPGHRRNLLDENEVGYRYTGIGAVRGRDGSVHVAQVFLK